MLHILDHDFILIKIETITITYIIEFNKLSNDINCITIVLNQYTKYHSSSYYLIIIIKCHNLIFHNICT